MKGVCNLPTNTLVKPTVGAVGFQTMSRPRAYGNRGVLHGPPLHEVPNHVTPEGVWKLRVERVAVERLVSQTTSRPRAHGNDLHSKHAHHEGGERPKPRRAKGGWKLVVDHVAALGRSQATSRPRAYRNSIPLAWASRTSAWVPNHVTPEGVWKQVLQQVHPPVVLVSSHVTLKGVWKQDPTNVEQVAARFKPRHAQARMSPDCSEAKSFRFVSAKILVRSCWAIRRAATLGGHDVRHCPRLPLENPYQRPANGDKR